MQHAGMRCAVNSRADQGDRDHGSDEAGGVDRETSGRPQGRDHDAAECGSGDLAAGLQQTQRGVGGLTPLDRDEHRLDRCHGWGEERTRAGGDRGQCAQQRQRSVVGAEHRGHAGHRDAPDQIGKDHDQPRLQSVRPDPAEQGAAAHGEDG
jgi:hypothetical protein